MDRVLSLPELITRLRLAELELERAWARVRELDAETNRLGRRNRWLEERHLWLLDARRWK
jgi:hypothetical protein